LEEAGGVCHVTSLVDKIESVANFSHYQNQLKDYSGRRAIFQHGHELLCMIGDAHLESSDILKKFNENVSRTLKQSISGRSLIQLVNPVEAVDYVPDEGVLLVGDQHIVRGDFFVIGGPAGIGKSRAATALALAGATQQDWFGLKVHTQFKTMIIQNENNQSRLASEYRDLPVEEMRDFVLISKPPKCGLAFGDSKFQAAITEHCESFNPDIVIIDPWGRTTSGDTKQDYSEGFDNIYSCMPGEPGPAIGIVAHTKKPKDSEKKMGRDALHELSGSFMLGAVPRSVFVMYAATNDPQDNLVIWQNAKNSDGAMSPTSAWHRKNGLFAPCPDFDWNGYENSSDKQTKCTIDALETVFKSGDGKLERKFAAEQLGEITGLGKSACYNALRTDGKFADYIAQDGDLLVWVDYQKTQIPLSNSTST